MTFALPDDPNRATLLAKLQEQEREREDEDRLVEFLSNQGKDSWESFKRMAAAGKRQVHYTYGVAAGVRRWGPKRGQCTVHGGAVSIYHSSFGCDSTPDPEEAGQRIAGVVQQ